MAAPLRATAKRFDRIAQQTATKQQTQPIEPITNTSNVNAVADDDVEVIEVEVVECVLLLLCIVIDGDIVVVIVD